MKTNIFLWNVFRANGEKIFSHIILTGVLALITAVPALADFNYPDFTSINGLNLVGSAEQNGNRIRLTTANMELAGATWYLTKQSVQNGFHTNFQFQISNWSSPPADGFAFVIQNQSQTALGGGGGAIGYGGPTLSDGIENSVAVEFDTYYNYEFPEPDAPHVSVHTRGMLPNSPLHDYSLGSTTNISNFVDDNIHTGTMNYIPGTLSIFLDNNIVLEVTLDLSSTLSLENGYAWVGFTAGTGLYYENHDILNWSFESIPEPASLLLFALGGLTVLRRRK